MNRFALELWDDECECCTFYTVRKENADNNETDKFFTKYDKQPYREDLNKIIQLLITQIGSKYGAIDAFFNRFERKAFALPPKKSRSLTSIDSLVLDHSFRLLCYRVNEDIVILFNGGLKDTARIQDSSEVSMYFYEAQNFVNTIENAFREKDLQIAGRKLFQGNKYNNIEL